MSQTRNRSSAWLSGLLALAAVAILALLDVEAAREEASRPQETDQYATQWLDLSEEEWRQYHARRALVGQPLAEMTPYEVLGIFAEDPEQRRRYARENARFMLDFYRRTMEFEAIYREELEKMSKP